MKYIEPEHYIIETPLGLVKFELLFPNMDWMHTGNYMGEEKVKKALGESYLSDLSKILNGKDYEPFFSRSIPDIYFIYKKAQTLPNNRDRAELAQLCEKLIRLALMDDNDDLGNVCVPTAQPNRRHYYYSSGNYTKEDVRHKTEQYIKIIPRLTEYKEINQAIRQKLIDLGIDLNSSIFSSSNYSSDEYEQIKKYGVDDVTYDFALAPVRLDAMTKFLDINSAAHFIHFMGTSEELQKKNAIEQVLNYHQKNWFALATIKKDFYSEGEGKKEHINFIAKGNRDRPWSLTPDLSEAYHFESEKELKSVLDRESELEFKSRDLLILEMKAHEITRCYGLMFDEKTNSKIIGFMEEINSRLLKKKIENEILPGAHKNEIKNAGAGKIKL